jgi:hypothetical protein
VNRRFSDDSIISRKDEIISGDVDGETVMMSIEGGNYHSLNETGSRIWELLESPCAVGRIIDALKDEYDTEPEVIAEEAYRFLGQLLERDVIQIDGPEIP